MIKNRQHLGVASFLILAAVGLHGYEHFVKAEDGPAFWFFVWALMPYVLCLIVLVLSASGIPVIAGAAVALALDAVAFYDVFINPQGSTAALALVFVPLWSTIIFVPITMVITRYVIRQREGAH